MGPDIGLMGPKFKLCPFQVTFVIVQLLLAPFPRSDIGAGVDICAGLQLAPFPEADLVDHCPCQRRRYGRFTASGRNWGVWCHRQCRRSHAARLQQRSRHHLQARAEGIDDPAELRRAPVRLPPARRCWVGSARSSMNTVEPIDRPGRGGR
jgi:hypothetical protein